MDIFAHGLWTAAATKLANRSQKIKEPISVGWAAFWGVFPDLFAFAPLFCFMAFEVIMGNVSLSHFPKPDSLEPAQGDTLFLLNLTSTLYSVSHSLLIFGAVVAMVYLVRKKLPLAMFGWLLHIIIDIPTHSYAFYPTPFLWPLSDVRFDGISWGTPWFMIANYSALIIVYAVLWHSKRKKVADFGILN